MHFRYGLVVALLGGALWPAGALAQQRDLRGYPERDVLDRYGLTHAWSAQVPLAKHREYITSLKIVEELLFAQSNYGTIHCLDAESGRINWSVQVGNEAGEVFPPALTKEFVYVAYRSVLTQLERNSGRVVWTKDLPNAASAGPAANNEFVYVPAGDNRLYAIALKDDHDRKFTKHPIAWFYQTYGYIQNPPIVLSDRVAFASSDGVVYAMTLASRRIYYRFLTNSTISAPLATLDRALYIAADNYNFFAVDLITGQAMWRFSSGYPIKDRPAPFLEDVFITPDGAGLICVDNTRGVMRWSNEDVTRFVAASRDHVYATDRKGTFTVLSRHDGAIQGYWPAQAFSISTENQYTDRVVLSTKDGLIVCMHEKANREPIRHPQSLKPLEKARRGAGEAAEDKSTKGKPRPTFFDEDEPGGKMEAGAPAAPEPEMAEEEEKPAKTAKKAAAKPKTKTKSKDTDAAKKKKAPRRSRETRTPRTKRKSASGNTT